MESGNDDRFNDNRLEDDDQEKNLDRFGDDKKIENNKRIKKGQIQLIF